MHDSVLLNVREQLLRAGIAPRHVNRYVMELRDHLTDLVARERSAGLDLHASGAKAGLILGSDTQLVQAMIDRGTPRSLATRAPWAVYGILPLVALVVSMILLSVFAMAILAPFGGLAGSAIPAYVRALGLLITFAGSYGIGPLLAAACIAIAFRQRQSSAWLWAGLALIALASGPLGVHVELPNPGSSGPAGIRGSLMQTVQTGGRVDVTTTLLLISIRALLLFALSALALRMLRPRAGAASA